MDDPQQPVLSKVYNRQAVTSVGEGKFPLRLANIANVVSEEVTSSENLEKHRIGTKTKVVSGDSNMVVNERDDMEKTLNYENSDLFTVKLELKGNQKVNKRHLLLNPDNIETKEEDIDPSNPHNGRKVTNYSNPFIAEPPVVEAKMGPIISPFQLKINTGKGPNNEGSEPKEFSFKSSQNACMPVPDLNFSGIAGYYCERAHGNSYWHQKENSNGKKNHTSPEKKRLKLGKKISPKQSRKKTIKHNSGTPELQKFFNRMKEKKNQKIGILPPKENVQKKESNTEDKDLKRKKSVMELMKKFETRPTTPQKERLILTPKRRKKEESNLKDEERKEKKGGEKESVGTMSQTLEDLASADSMSILKN